LFFDQEKNLSNAQLKCFFFVLCRLFHKRLIKKSFRLQDHDCCCCCVFSPFFWQNFHSNKKKINFQVQIQFLIQLLRLFSSFFSKLNETFLTLYKFRSSPFFFFFFSLSYFLIHIGAGINIYLNNFFFSRCFVQLFVHMTNTDRENEQLRMTLCVLFVFSNSIFTVQ